MTSCQMDRGGSGDADATAVRLTPGGAWSAVAPLTQAFFSASEILAQMSPFCHSSMLATHLASSGDGVYLRIRSISYEHRCC